MAIHMWPVIVTASFKLKEKEDTVYTYLQWFKILSACSKTMAVEMCAQNMFSDFTKHLDTFFEQSV
jgi:hypothetical protein